MIFDDYKAVDSVCYDLKLGDFPRAKNRAKINDLFNGLPPYSAEDVEKSNIKVNFNDLTATIQGHDARAQLYSAFNKPGNYFTCRTDMGTKHKRMERGVIVTREINRIMKRSLEYYECYRSKIALNVLHGIGPGAWDGPNRWCPDPLGIEDVLVPAGTFLTLRNLDRFALYRSYSWPELVRLTQGPQVDPGWDQKQIKAIGKWFNNQAVEMMGNNWPEVWSPDKLSEGMKEDTGWYMGDRMPTLDVFDFYFWSDEGNKEGWYRRMIIDAWSTPNQMPGGGYAMYRKSDDIFKRDGFLYTSGKRVVADKWSKIVSFQFADLSAVAPFRYHSVRSLGWLIYAPCMWQNLLRCRFNEHVFENLMQYFRIRSFDDYQRALKIELINRGFIDETVEFVKQQDRWQINPQVAQAAFEQWDHLIRRSSASYVQPLPNEQDKTRKTAFQVQTEVNSTAGLVTAAFEQAYRYQGVEYREDFRRFCNPHSTDPEVNVFRANCLRQGVPEKMLVEEAWDLEPERLMGAGNKSIEAAIANWLMQYRNLYDPEPQRQILHQATLLVTDDVAFADQLVPENPEKVTDSAHDAELAAGALMQGVEVRLKTGMNHIEYVETLLTILGQRIAEVEQRGGMASPDQIKGFIFIAKNIGEHIAIIAQDENEKERVKKYGDALGKLMNMVKAYQQRLQEMMQKQQQAQGGNGQMDPRDAAKIQADRAVAMNKIDLAKQSHAQKTVQRRMQFQQKQQEQAQKHQLDVAATDLKTAAEIRQNRMRSMAEPEPESKRKDT